MSRFVTSITNNEPPVLFAHILVVNFLSKHHPCQHIYSQSISRIKMLGQRRPWTSLCLSVLCVSHTAWCFRPWNNIIILRYHIQQNWISSSKINCLGWKEDILVIEITFALVNVHSNFVTIDYFTILRCRIQSNTRKPLSYYNTRLHSVQHSDSQ